MNDRPSSQGIDLHAVWRGRYVVAACIGSFVALGAAYLLVTSPSYEAEARVLVQRDELVFDRNEDRLKDKAFLATQGEVLASPLLIGRALENSPITVTDAEKDPVEVALKQLEVAPLVETDVLRIRFTAPAEGEAPRFIRALLDTYREDAAESSRTEFAESIELLREEERQVRSELETVQAEYLTLRDGEAQSAGDGAEHLTRELSGRLADTRARRVELERRLAVLKKTMSEAVNVPGEDTSRRPSDAVIQILVEEEVLAVEDIADLRRRRSEAEQRRALLAGFGSRHPVRRGVDAEIRRLDEMLATRVSEAAVTLEREYELAVAAERDLERIHSAAGREARRATESDLREELLVTNIDRLTRLHETTLQRLSDYRLADGAVGKGRATVHVRVLEGPELTEKKVWPLPVPILGACLLLGSVVGLGVVSLTEGTPSDANRTTSSKSVEDDRLADIEREVAAAREEIAAANAVGREAVVPGGRGDR